MPALCKLLTGLGFTGVKSLLQSGNVVFTCGGSAGPALEKTAGSRESPDVREHRPDPRRRLGHHRRRRRQLPDALPRQRRVGVARDPRRARVDLPFRGSGHGLQAARGPLLSLPLPRAAAAGAGAVMLGGWSAGRAARNHRLAPGERGDQAGRADRRASRRTAALFDALYTEFSEVKIERNPNCPVCGDSPTITEYIDYVEFCTR